MSSSWLNGIFGRSVRRAGAQTARVIPRVTRLEERDVPATFFVDPSATAAQPTFNAGRPDAHTGTFGTDVFNNFTNAITAANTAPGQDTIRLAYTDQIFFVNSPADTPVFITDSVDIQGSGAGTSVLQTDPANNQSGAVLAARGAGVRVDFTGVTFFGGADAYDPAAPGDVAASNSITGVFVRYQAGATGTIDGAAFRGIFANGFGGFGATAVGAQTHLTIRNSSFATIGRVGAAADDSATLDLFGNTYSGKGAGNYVDYFAQYTGGATGTVSGNTVTGNSGIAPGGLVSAAVLVNSGGGAAASARIFGNTFSGNGAGVVVGDPAFPGDASTVTASYNNIFGNLTGVGANPSTGTPIDASHTYFGSPTGPFNATTNPSGQGNTVADRVQFAPVATTPNPVDAAPTLADYLATNFPPPPPPPPRRLLPRRLLPRRPRPRRPRPRS